MIRKFFSRLLIILVLLVGFLYGYYQGYNAGVEYMVDELWEDVVYEEKISI